MQENEQKTLELGNAKITIEDVKAAWGRFDRMKERAEQHDFANILVHDLIFTKLYNDLLTNWNEKHAQKFVYALNTYIEKMGYGV